MKTWQSESDKTFWDTEDDMIQHEVLNGYRAASTEKEIKDQDLLPTLESFTNATDETEDIPIISDEALQVTGTSEDAVEEPEINQEALETGGGEFGGAGASEDF